MLQFPFPSKDTQAAARVEATAIFKGSPLTNLIVPMIKGSKSPVCIMMVKYVHAERTIRADLVVPADTWGSRVEI